MTIILRLPLIRLRQCLLIFSSLVITSLFLHSQSTNTISFATNKISIDGDKSDWNNFPIKIHNPIDEIYRNDNSTNLAWDTDNLYVIFDIKDKNLCINERGENSPRLYFNDGVEIYIDTKNDSKSKMDKNDYQFLLSISNEKTIFKGDKYLIKEGYTVPKDNENTNIIIHAKANHVGTINKVKDIDTGYVVEVAIPWTTIGIIPQENMYIKLDLCVNDVDTFTNISVMPDTIHPKSLNYINLKGKTEFGYPDDWTTFQLIGKPGMYYTLTNLKLGEAIPLFLFIALILVALIFTIYRQYKRINFYKSFPTKSAQESKTITADVNEEKITKTNPLIDELNQYINSHIENEITIEDLAKSCNIGIRQLQRLTKSELNLTPIQHLTIIKLEKACDDLKNSTLTVSEIAYKYNFSDPSYFGSVFKKYYGVSAGEWRKGEQ